MQVLDYILHSRELRPCRRLGVPADIGAARLPSAQFPSDHLPLVVDLAPSSNHPEYL